ncbi:hypothetical protein GUJ93_ZPchr0011g27310 [Zizania palustris]|uniref:Uncharacterized protein n=1 Tax=Zizania palustris TaxID=103762 RepID=A0A8J5WGB0_ZIZPA|nr:hypothetical protein GUJ93_ZPchr0011g27310 [Zizania palustris]
MMQSAKAAVSSSGAPATTADDDACSSNVTSWYACLAGISVEVKCGGVGQAQYHLEVTCRRTSRARTPADSSRI